MSKLTTGRVTSPATMNVSLPLPPMILVVGVVGGAEDVEGVVALEAVDLERFLGVGQFYRQPGAEDAGVGHHEGVVLLGAERHHPVEAGAAVDVDRGVDVVLDEVIAVAAVDLDLGAVAEREGADDEGVVAGLAFRAQVGLVGIDLEEVVAGAAIDDGRIADAARQVAEGRLDRVELVAERRCRGRSSECSTPFWSV